MERECFLCKVPATSLVTSEWALPAVGSHPIGFSICERCGLVLQSPTTSPEITADYYKETASYLNPGRAGKPPAIKVTHLGHLIDIMRRTAGSIPATAFQVGCSDGYTLARFREAGAQVEGIDPSLASCELAATRYGIEIVAGAFEAFVPTRTFELLILTHVLEHLLEPCDAVAKCGRMQQTGGWLLVEVPLLERPDRLPPGYLTYEHLNYFSEATLLRLLEGSGYAPYLVEKWYHLAIYPAITVIARKEASSETGGEESDSDYLRARRLIDTYLTRESVRWGRVDRRARSLVEPGQEIYLWGAGIHTSQLLANTGIGAHATIKALLDGSPTKWGRSLGPYRCLNPDEVELTERDAILISSFASEDEIYQNLGPLRERGVTVLRLYHGGDSR